MKLAVFQYALALAGMAIIDAPFLQVAVGGLLIYMAGHISEHRDQLRRRTGAE